MKQGIKLLSICLACCVLFSSVVLAKSETDSLMGKAIRASLKEIEEEEIVLGENKVVAVIYKASFGELTRLHIVPNGGFLVDYHFGSPEDPAPKAVKRIMDSRGISYPNKLPLVIKNVDRHIAVLIELEVDGESKRTDFLKQYGDEIEGYGKYVFDKDGTLVDFIKGEPKKVPFHTFQKHREYFMEKFGANGKTELKDFYRTKTEKEDKEEPQEKLKAPASTLRLTNQPQAFLKGTSAETFSPNDVLTWAQASAMLARLSEGFRAEDISYEDLLAAALHLEEFEGDAWYAKEVTFLHKQEIYEEVANAFRPNTPISRGEFAMLLQRVVSAVDGTEYAPIYKGKNAKMNLALGKAKAAGWLNGYADGSMGANKHLTRAEAVTIFCRMTGVPTNQAMKSIDPKKLFTDIQPKDWFYFAVVNGARLFSE